MNHSIIARCAHSGRIGIAVASVSLAAGARLHAAIRPHAGGILIQGACSFRLNTIANRLLGQGHTAAYVMQQLEFGDPDFDLRQIAIVDRESAVATHCPASIARRGGIRAGAGYATLCEGAVDGRAADLMAEAFEAAPAEDLDQRLLCALEAGGTAPRSAGGLPLRSASLVMWGWRDYSELEVQVDMHDKPVGELRRIHTELKPSVAYYEEGSRDPTKATAADAISFAGRLSKERE